MAKIRDKYDLSELARQIQELRSRRPGDSAYSRMFMADNLHSILESCIAFDPEVSDSDKSTLVGKIFQKAHEHPKIDQKILMSCIEQAESEYLSLDLKEYVLATSLTVRYFKNLKPIEVRGSKIVFLPFLPKKFNREKLTLLIQIVNKTAILDKGVTVLVTVKARTEVSAADKALFALDLIRGIWNYHLNRQTKVTWSDSIPRKDTINKILLGPVHTLHTANGELASELLWWQPENQQVNTIFNLETVWEDVNRATKLTRRLYPRAQYSRDIESFFVRYARALDFWDFDIAYNKLWSLLEILVYASGRYDELIRRSLFICHDDEKDYLRLILEHLRYIRNSLVHDDVSYERARFHCYQIKWFVEILIRFHVFYGHGFKSLKEVGLFLDLPKEERMLQEKVSLYRQALKFRKAWWPKTDSE